MARGVIVNNMGVENIEVRVRAILDNNVAELAETAQRFAVRGAPAISSQPWQVFDVAGWQEDEDLVLVWKREQAGPTDDDVMR